MDLEYGQPVLSHNIISGTTRTYVNHTCGAGSQTPLDQFVVRGEVGSIQCTAKLVVDKILPTNWEPEDVHTIILGKVLHLPDSTASCQPIPANPMARSKLTRRDHPDQPTAVSFVLSCMLPVCGVSNGVTLTAGILVH